MIAAWMLYCALCALLLSAAAVLVERVLLKGRGALRTVWAVALLLSLLIPALAFRIAPRVVSSQPESTAAAGIVPLPAPQREALQTEPAHSTQTTSAVATWNWRTQLAQLDQPLMIAWFTLSLAVACNLLGGVVLLSWMRRRWRRENVLGVPVLVSTGTGPAVVGVVAPAIVLPEWVLALPPVQLALLLRHEQEHQQAGDGRLLTLAQLALIVMPWNLVLWWQILRLRAAVELDCDARVLQHADARSYGDLLLQVARPPRRPAFLGATAFAEHATQLERRIRVLARHRVPTSRAARASALAIAVIALSAAWVTPRPAVPANPPETPQAPEVPQMAPRPARTAAALDVPQGAVVAEPRPAPRVPGAEVVESSSASAQRAAAPPDSQVEQQASPQVDSILRRLLVGISTTPIQRARVRELLTRLEREQIAADQNSAAGAQTSVMRTRELNAQRDSALRALLTTDADRARFDANRVQGGGGRGGRGGGVPVIADTTRQYTRTVIPDSGRTSTWIVGRAGGGGVGDTLAGRGARRGGGGGRGGGGARGGQPDSALTSVANVLDDLMYRRLFAGIELTPDQETRARTLISRTQLEMRTVRPFTPPILRWTPDTGEITMREESAADLAALFQSDADRAAVLARIRTVQPR